MMAKLLVLFLPLSYPCNPVDSQETLLPPFLHVHLRICIFMCYLLAFFEPMLTVELEPSPSLRIEIYLNMIKIKT